MDTRDSKGRFLPGNPGGGRKKKDPTTKDLLRALSPQAVTCLGDLIHSDDEAVALQASFDILDLVLKHDTGSNVPSLADDEREEYENEILDRMKMLERARRYFDFVKRVAQDNCITFRDDWEDIITGRVTTYSFSYSV